MTKTKTLFQLGDERYTRRKAGIFVLTDGEKKRVCGFLRFAARITSLDNHETSIEIRFRNVAGEKVVMLVPPSDCMGRFPVTEKLVDAGFEIVDHAIYKRMLPGLWSNDPPVKTKAIVSRPGWHQLKTGSVYVTRSWIATAGADGDKGVHVGLTPGIENPVEIRGSLADWNAEIGALCIANPRLAFAVCAALTAPVLRLVDARNIGLGFVGGSSLGKTTGLEVAASVFGPPDRYIGSWNATEKALGEIAKAFSDSPLILDEMAEFAAADLARASYTLLNGKSRRRLGAGHELNELERHRHMLLFGTEETVAATLAEAGLQAHGGQVVRMLTIPLGTHGMFSKWDGFDGPAALAEALHERTKRVHGALARAWVKKLVATAEKRVTRIRKRQEEARRHLLQELPTGVPRNIAERVTESMALVAAVGESAIAAKILNWKPETALRAVTVCVKAWARHYVAEQAERSSDPVAPVKRFLQSESTGRFLPYTQYGSRIKRNDLAGFEHVLAGTPVFLMYSSYFEEHFCKKTSKRALLNLMKERGYLMTDSGSHLTKQVAVPNGKKRKITFYVIRKSIVES